MISWRYSWPASKTINSTSDPWKVKEKSLSWQLWEKDGNAVKLMDWNNGNFFYFVSWNFPNFKIKLNVEMGKSPPTNHFALKKFHCSKHYKKICHQYPWGIFYITNEHNRRMSIKLKCLMDGITFKSNWKWKMIMDFKFYRFDRFYPNSKLNTVEFDAIMKLVVHLIVTLYCSWYFKSINCAVFVAIQRFSVNLLVVNFFAG